MWSSTTAANPRSSRARSPGDTARQRSNAARERAMAASVSSAEVAGTVATTSSVTGLITSCTSTLSPYSLSKPRSSSQSVTAASNAASSTRALLA